MQMAWCLHAVKRVAVCGMCMLGSLILLGCGDDASSSGEGSDGASSGLPTSSSGMSDEALLVAQAPYYAALDAAFPEGKPGLTTVEERDADEAYKAQCVDLMQQRVALERTAAEHRKAAEAYREVLLEVLRTRLGEEPLPEVLEEALAKSDHYRGLVQATEAAEAAVDAKRVEISAFIRARQCVNITRYDELKAAADAAVQAAGLPVRVESPTSVVAKDAADAPKPAVGTMDVKDLSKETGIPIAPSAP